MNINYIEKKSEFSLWNATPSPKLVKLKKEMMKNKKNYSHDIIERMGWVKYMIEFKEQMEDSMNKWNDILKQIDKGVQLPKYEGQMIFITKYQCEKMMKEIVSISNRIGYNLELHRNGFYYIVKEDCKTCFDKNIYDKAISCKCELY